jgi:signal transduction histidine kinase
MLQKFKVIPLSSIFLIVIIVIAMNSFYYQYTKTILIDNQKEKMSILTDAIKTSIDQSTAGEKFVEDLIGQNLRTASIAALYKLDPDIEKVDNQQLVDLSKKLGIADITLFKKTETDIVGLKSSDPKEINISSKNWGDFYEAFKQLFDKHKVENVTGQTLENYWSGAMDTSSARIENVDKWGYFYDGSTNYLINPFVHDTIFRQYQAQTGVDLAINKIIDTNIEVAKEISVINTDMLLEKPNYVVPEIPNWYSQRLVLFGKYNYRDSDEKKYAQQALETKKSVYYLADVEGKTYLKSFTPLSIIPAKYNADQEQPLLEMASDYSVIQAKLSKQIKDLILIIIISTLVCVLIIGLTIRILNRKNNKAVQSVQDVYKENIDSLFQSIREQKHDFNNQLSTIQSLVTLGQFDELKKYTESFIGENKVINDLIDINIPILGALVMAKMAHADNLQITFEHSFENMGQLNIETLKSTDLVRIISNIVDNAFDATIEMEPDQRIVKLMGRVDGQQLKFDVLNSGKTIPDQLHHQIFEAGYTTKQGKNLGLGLNIVKRLVKKYHGSIHLESEKSFTKFSVILPAK